MKLLLVEDAPRLQRLVARGLREAGYAVDVCANGQEALWLGQQNDYDVIILDLMLPGMDGLEVLRRWRDGGRNMHVLLLTARDTVADRVRGLEAGADDYLIKPFAFEELLARVAALCRRRYGQKSQQIVVGELNMDLVARKVTVAGHPVSLSAHEYALLEYLALRRGQVVSREEIEAHIYGESTDVMSNVVDRAICVLRRKLDLPGRPSFITTRRGLGYVLQGGGE